MAKKIVQSVQKGIRFPAWMYEAIQEIANEQKATFADIVVELLRQELAAMGYTMGIGREGADDKRAVGNPNQAEGFPEEKTG